MNWFTATVKWLVSIFSERDGSGSSTRVLIFMTTSTALGVLVTLTYLVCHKAVTVEQLDAAASTLGQFVITVGAPLYGINKLADWANNKLPKA